jgi:hypothetical protein
MCEEEAFFQAYMDYMARKQVGAAGAASAFKAEAVDTAEESIAPSAQALSDAADKPKSS